MQRVQHTLIRIIKGPTGGFLASLGIAAVLGGVALATPAPPVAAVTDHHPDVISAVPLGTPIPVSAGTLVATGGMHTDADPTGRGSAIHGGPSSNGVTSDGGPGAGRNETFGGAHRSAGASPAHQDARDDPTPHGQHPHRPGDHASGGNQSPGAHPGPGAGDGDGHSGGGSGSSTGAGDGDHGSGGQSGGEGEHGSGGQSSGEGEGSSGSNDGNKGSGGGDGSNNVGGDGGHDGETPNGSTGSGHGGSGSGSH
jgi:hypothetical protein